MCCSCVESGDTSVPGTPEAYLGNVSGGPSDAILGAHPWGERKMVINVVNFMVIFHHFNGDFNGDESHYHHLPTLLW